MKVVIYHLEVDFVMSFDNKVIVNITNFIYREF